MQFRHMDLRSIGPTVKVITKSNSGPISALSLQYKPRNLWQNNVYGSNADFCPGDSNIFDSVVKKRDHNAYLEFWAPYSTRMNP